MYKNIKKIALTLLFVPFVGLAQGVRTSSNSFAENYWLETFSEADAIDAIQKYKQDNNIDSDCIAVCAFNEQAEKSIEASDDFACETENEKMFRFVHFYYQSLLLQAIVDVQFTGDLEQYARDFFAVKVLSDLIESIEGEKTSVGALVVIFSVYQDTVETFFDMDELKDFHVEAIAPEANIQIQKLVPIVQQIALAVSKADGFKEQFEAHFGQSEAFEILEAGLEVCKLNLDRTLDDIRQNGWVLPDGWVLPACMTDN